MFVGVHVCLALVSDSSYCCLLCSSSPLGHSQCPLPITRLCLPLPISSSPLFSVCVCACVFSSSSSHKHLPIFSLFFHSTPTLKSHSPPRAQSLQKQWHLETKTLYFLWFAGPFWYVEVSLFTHIGFFVYKRDLYIWFISTTHPSPQKAGF